MVSTTYAICGYKDVGMYATPEEILESYEEHGSIVAVSKELKASRRRILRVLREEGVRDTPQVSVPLVPAVEEPIEDIIERSCQRVERKIAQVQSKKWMPFEVDTDEPIAVTFFGDPHLDNKYCNWPALKATVNVMQHPRFFGVNMGDLTDNWVGRLIAEYAEAPVTRSDSWRLAEWFIHKSGVNWLVHILGNHDNWNDGAAIFNRINGGVYPAEDWRAQFKLVFSNGVEVKVDAAHDHKGHSQYNPLHGQKKVALAEEPADIIIGGHKHTWGISCEENPHTGFVMWLARARGYKLSQSSYDARGQWGDQQLGADITAVIDPRKPQAERVQLFNCAEKARAYLDSL